MAFKFEFFELTRTILTDNGTDRHALRIIARVEMDLGDRRIERSNRRDSVRSRLADVLLLLVQIVDLAEGGLHRAEANHDDHRVVRHELSEHSRVLQLQGAESVVEERKDCGGLDRRLADECLGI